MTKILPDFPDSPSSWKTENHYFNLKPDREERYIQFAITGKNITDDFRAICDRINEFYSIKMGKEDWQWWTPFRFKTIKFGEELSKEETFAGLDECF